MGASTLKGNSPNFTKCTKCRQLIALISRSALSADPKMALISLCTLIFGSTNYWGLKGVPHPVTWGPTRAGQMVKSRGDNAIPPTGEGHVVQSPLPYPAPPALLKGG